MTIRCSVNVTVAMAVACLLAHWRRADERQLRVKVCKLANRLPPHRRGIKRHQMPKSIRNSVARFRSETTSRPCLLQGRVIRHAAGGDELMDEQHGEECRELEQWHWHVRLHSSRID